MITQMTLDLPAQAGVIGAVGTILVAMGLFVVLVGVLGAILALQELRGYRVLKDQIRRYVDCLDEAQRIIRDLQVTLTCTWKHDRHFDYWDTACGEAFMLLDGTPSDNKMRFCPYCGRRLMVAEPDAVESDD